VTPELVRKICWQQPPASSSEYENFVIEQLTSMGARPWQIELVTPAISASLPQTEPLIIPEPAEAEGEPEVAQ
jgi:ribonuclease D